MTSYQINQGFSINYKLQSQRRENIVSRRLLTVAHYKSLIDFGQFGSYASMAIASRYRAQKIVREMIKHHSRTLSPLDNSALYSEETSRRFFEIRTTSMRMISAQIPRYLRQNIKFAAGKECQHRRFKMWRFPQAKKINILVGLFRF